MKKRMSRIIIAIGIIVLFIGVSTLGASTQLIEFNSRIFLRVTHNQENLNMLIFVSPQYTHDTEIRNAITSYATAVKDDINWNTKIISLKQEQNDYKKIDQIIEKYYELYEIKACIMVGEDTDTALGGDSGYMKKPSTVPWFTIGGEHTYKISEQGIVCQPYKMDICISLIYPTNDLDYETKRTQIIDAFNKFSSQRYVALDKEILVFESSDINTNSKDMYKGLSDYGNVYYNEDPTDLEIKKSLTVSYSMYIVHGHSNPSGTDIIAGEGGWFSADTVDQLDTPFFGTDGCYVGGWWSDQLDTNTLNPSIDCTWYGSKIFTSKNVKVMVLGLLSQNGFSYPVSFIENALPDLFNGKTLAESMIGGTYLGDTVVIGDPTFQYTLEILS